MSNHPILHDRVKQFSYVTGTSAIDLTDAASGFSTFRYSYNDGDKLFYAITDGSAYEVGSGVFSSGSVLADDRLTRNVIKSSNNNAMVSWGDGRKEVFATYPATHAVMTGSGIAGFDAPEANKLAIWGSDHILNYDADLTWNHATKTLGIRNSSPLYGIDIGGNGGSQSIISASGYICGINGFYFKAGNGSDSSYTGGYQYKHFLPNSINDANTNAIFAYSGDVNQILGVKQQNAGTVLAGPTDECTPNCSPGMPSFRSLTIDDMPSEVATNSGVDTKILAASGDLNTKVEDRITFQVSNNGTGSYAISGVGTSGTANPDLWLQKGLTYHFDVDAVGHPFWIKESGAVGTTHQYNDNVTNNGTQSGIITFTVPQNAPPRLYYNCQYHPAMSGNIYTQSLIQGTPASRTDTGFYGSMKFDDNYLYIHVSSGWRRVGLTDL